MSAIKMQIKQKAFDIRVDDLSVMKLSFRILPITIIQTVLDEINSKNNLDMKVGKIKEHKDYTSFKSYTFKIKSKLLSKEVLRKVILELVLNSATLIKGFEIVYIK